MQDVPQLPFTHNSDPLFTEAEAALYLRVSLSSMRRERKEGHGPAYMRDGQLIRYRQSQLDRYVASRTQCSTTESA